MGKGKYFTHVEPKLFMIQSWARDGDTEEAIAIKLEVAYSTFRVYIKKYPALSAVLKNNKDIADYQVVDSLHKKCVGTYAKEGRAFKCKRVWYDDNGKRCEEEFVEVVEVDVFIPPDTMAMAIWLNNRMPDKWRRNANKEKLDADKFEHEKKKDDKKFW